MQSDTVPSKSPLCKTKRSLFAKPLRISAKIRSLYSVFAWALASMADGAVEDVICRVLLLETFNTMAGSSIPAVSHDRLCHTLYTLGFYLDVREIADTALPWHNVTCTCPQHAHAHVTCACAHAHAHMSNTCTCTCTCTCACTCDMHMHMCMHM